jgi:hypothetical protein
MANRTTATEVRVVINTDLLDADVTSFIDIANELVTAELGTSGLSATRLEHIELFLSAHFVAIRDKDEGRVVREYVSDEARIDYIDNFGRALEGTSYGQQALILDTTGTLSNLGKLRAQFRVM